MQEMSPVPLAVIFFSFYLRLLRYALYKPSDHLSLLTWRVKERDTSHRLARGNDTSSASPGTDEPKLRLRLTHPFSPHTHLPEKKPPTHILLPSSCMHTLCILFLFLFLVSLSLPLLQRLPAPPGPLSTGPSDLRSFPERAGGTQAGMEAEVSITDILFSAYRAFLS